ncbi:hypothetical protein FS749_008915 [Ceratobasidium sp. UAMH 11750]|nr:hypothetical protein FS749_008915 [Ceratobasidium sp. UAMH 11750]
MLRPRRNSNTPDQAAARVFEARLKQHVQENPDCQWELDWFRGALTRSVRRSRIQIDQEVQRQPEQGWPLCREFMQELAKPHSHLDVDVVPSPELDLFVSELLDQHDAGDSSPEPDPPLGALSLANDAFSQRNTSFDSVTTLGDLLEGARPPASSSQALVPFIQLTAPQPLSRTEDDLVADNNPVVRKIWGQAPPANSAVGGNPAIQVVDNRATPGPSSSSTAQRTIQQLAPAKEPTWASSGGRTTPHPSIEPKQPVPKVSQPPSASRPQIESRSTPIQQPEPKLDLGTLPKPGVVPPKTQSTNEPLPSSKRAPAPSQTSKTQPQRTVDNSQRGQSAAPGDNPSPEVSQPKPKIPPPNVVQAPQVAKPAEEPPSPKLKTRPDLSSSVVDGTQQAVPDRGGSFTTDLGPASRSNMQPDAKLHSPEPAKPGVYVELPGQNAPPKIDIKFDDHPVFTPVSASTIKAESVPTPRDTAGPQPRVQPSSPTPPGGPESRLDPAATKADQLCKKAGQLAHQFDTYGNLDDLDEAIEAYGQAAELLAPSPDALAVSSYLNLGRMMRVKFEAFYDIKDLDSAFDDALIKAHDLLRSTPTHELYRDVLHELAAASLDRYLYDGAKAAGDDTQWYCEHALNAESLGPKRAETYCVSSRLHLARFEYFSRDEDAVGALESLDAASGADPTLNREARYMENRAQALFACYRTRRPEYDGCLREALSLARQARDLTPTTTIQHPIASTLLADLLLARYERSHHQPDLDEALELLERAVRQVSYVRPEQPWIGERLARALMARFAGQGVREDLDDAISFLEIAVNLTVTNEHRRRTRLAAFGGALTLRFRYLALGEALTGDDGRALMAGIGSM